MQTAPPVPETDFIKLLDRKFNTQYLITGETRAITKELASKYCQLYDLKMTSKIEDIDSEHSLVSVAKAQKIEHAINMEKKRIAQ